MFRVGSGAGFSGDRVDAAIPVVELIAAHGEGGAIIFETIGERTLALGQLAKRENPKGDTSRCCPNSCRRSSSRQSRRVSTW